MRSVGDLPDPYAAIAVKYGGQVTMNARGDIYVGGTGESANLIAAGIADFERRLRGEASDS